MKIIDDKLMNGQAEETKKSPKSTKDIYFAGGERGMQGIACTECACVPREGRHTSYADGGDCR